jgi:hypothetical protein
MPKATRARANREAGAPAEQLSTSAARPKEIKPERRRPPTLATLIQRGSLGPADDPETDRKIGAARRWYSIMKCEEPEPHGTSWNFHGCPISSSVDSTKADRYLLALGRSIADGRAKAALQRGVPRFFSKVLDAIIVENMTTAAAALVIFRDEIPDGKVNGKWEARTIDRLNSALLHVAINAFRQPSERSGSVSGT